jgi:hypothetical protein
MSGLQSCAQCGATARNNTAKYCRACGLMLSNGQAGTAYSLLDQQQYRSFEEMLQDLRTLTNELRTLIHSAKGMSARTITKPVMVSTEIAAHSVEPHLNGSSASYAYQRSNDTSAESNGVTEDPNAQPEEQGSAILAWLNTLSISLKDYRQPEASDNIFDQLSLFLGNHFRKLFRLHDSIRKNLTTGNPFSLNLSTRSQDEIIFSTQFANTLKDYAFLSSYRYNKETKTIYATPQRVGKVINFFNGGWFERFIFLKIASLLSHHNLQYEYLNNPKISLSNGDVFELDMLFLVEGQPLWIECKTGDYQTYINRYCNFRKTISTPKDNSILIILDIADSLAKNLTNLYDITVANHETFLVKVHDALGLPSIGYPADFDQAVSIPPVDLPSHPIIGNLHAFLNKWHLRPLPEYRMSVIKQLIAIYDTLEEPKNVIEIKALLAEKMPITKNQLQDLLNVIFHSGCFLGEDGEPITSFMNLAPQLISYDPQALEQKCLEKYASVILLTDSHYFNNQHNLQEFEQVIGARPPAPETIAQIKQTLNIS